MRRLSFWVVVLLNVFSGVIACAGYEEQWDTNPPAANHWFYYDGNLSKSGDAEMDWQPTGGLSGGYVQCPLNELAEWETTPGAYYPAYTYDNPPAKPFHSIDLIADPVIQMAVKDLTASGAVDFGGGSLYFWIGEWIDRSPQEPGVSFFYYDTALMVGEEWNLNSIRIGDGNWVTVVDNQGKTASDLLVHPQQWGLGIFGGAAVPMGVLGVDSLLNVPEPSISALIVGELGFFALWRKD